jgi:glycerate 2-kinase
VLSDVAGNRLDVVGSGPTHPDPTTFTAAWDALAKYGLAEEPRPAGGSQVAECMEAPLEAARVDPPGCTVTPRRAPSRIPAAVLAHLQRGLRGEIEETPKPGDAAFARAHSCVVADNRTALEAMRRRAESQGLPTFVLDEPVRGEAREAGAALGRMLLTGHDAIGLEAANPTGRIFCVIFGGETTVTVRGGGRGGRNQEMAVGAALELAAAADPGSVVLLAAGTDGIDGNSEAAGGLVDATTIMRAERIGLDPREALDRNDCTPFLGALGDLVVTGLTGTNVMDVGVGVIWSRAAPTPQAT